MDVLFLERIKEVKYKKLNAVIIILSIVALTSYILYTEGYDNIVKTLHMVNMKFIAIAVLLMTLGWLIEGLILHVVAKKFHHKQTYWLSLKTTMIGQFFNCVTPSASGGQPMQVYYMAKNGIPIGLSTSILMVKLIVYQVVIAICLLLALILKFAEFSSQIDALKYVILIGFIINTVLTGGCILLCFFKGAALKILSWIIPLLHKIRIIKSPEEKYAKASEEINKFYTSIQLIRKSKLIVASMSFLAFMQVIFRFAITYFIYLSFGLRGSSMISIMAAQAFVTNISYYVPLPGAIGGAEASFFAFYRMFFPGRFINFAMLIWRFITFYLQILVGGIFSLLFMKDRKAKK